MEGETLLAVAYGSMMVLCGVIVWQAVIRFYHGDDDS